MNWKKRLILKEKHRQHIIRLVELYGSIFAALILCALISLFYVKNKEKTYDYRFPNQPVSDIEIIRGDTSKRQIIFTFDGGSNSKSAQNILNALAKHNIRGTFFLTGTFVKKYPELTREIVREGHEVFNHTMDHPHLTEIRDADIIHELNFMDANFYAVTGSSTKPYFRPPYGDRDGRVVKVASRAGYRSVYWTVDARDWEESEGQTAEQTKDLILSTLAPGNIYLMHIGDNITGQILDEIITKIEEMGYKIVPLTEGL